MARKQPTTTVSRLINRNAIDSGIGISIPPRLKVLYIPGSHQFGFGGHSSRELEEVCQAWELLILVTIQVDARKFDRSTQRSRQQKTIRISQRQIPKAIGALS